MPDIENGFILNIIIALPADKHYQISK